jgi:hypothetical protein
MCYTCRDCQQPVAKKGLRGPTPQRCEVCNKRRTAFRQRQCQKRYCEKIGRPYRGRDEDVSQCCDCGHATPPRGNRGPIKLRCESCSKRKQKEGRRLRHEQSKARFSHQCERCKKTFCCPRSRQPYCSYECMHLGQRRRITVKCARSGCETYFEAQPGQLQGGRRYCCRECSYPPKHVCQNPSCGKPFRPKHKRANSPWAGKGKYCCKTCYQDHRFGVERPGKRPGPALLKAASRSALKTSLRKKCRLLNVPFDPECTRHAVCERDSWVCQLCHVKCNVEYILDPVTRTPSRLNAEHDHIIALTTAGSPGNVFPNSQCLCRACNSSKRTKSRGQHRLDFEGSVKRWENEDRRRRQRHSRSCEETPASAV